MNFDWQYTLRNNVVTAPALLIAAVILYFLGGSGLAWTLIGIDVVLSVGYYFMWKRPFLRTHPDLNRKNRTIRRDNFYIGSNVLFVIGIVVIVNIRPDGAALNAFLIGWAAVALLIDDGFTVPKDLISRKPL